MVIPTPTIRADTRIFVWEVERLIYLINYIKKNDRKSEGAML